MREKGNKKVKPIYNEYVEKAKEKGLDPIKYQAFYMQYFYRGNSMEYILTPKKKQTLEEQRLKAKKGMRKRRMRALCEKAQEIRILATQNT